MATDGTFTNFSETWANKPVDRKKLGYVPSVPTLSCPHVVTYQLPATRYFSLPISL